MPDDLPGGRATVIGVVTDSTVGAASLSGLANTPGSADDLALAAMVAFVVLLVQKEAVGSATTRTARTLARGLNIGLVPLGLVCVMNIVARLFQAWQ